MRPNGYVERPFLSSNKVHRTRICGDKNQRRKREVLVIAPSAGGLRRATSDELPAGPFSTARRSRRPLKTENASCDPKKTIDDPCLVMDTVFHQADRAPRAPRWRLGFGSLGYPLFFAP